MQITPEWMVLSNLITSLVTLVVQKFGERAKLLFEERKDVRSRGVSEQDLWLKLGAMEQRIATLTEELGHARLEAAALKVEVAILRSDNERLRQQLQPAAAPLEAHP